MNKKFFSLIAAFSAATLFAVPAAKTPMQAALEKVDQGGEFLMANTAMKNYLKFVNTPPAQKSKEAQFQMEFSQRLTRVFGQNLVQAQSASSKEVSPGCWIYKNYTYLGKKNMQLPSIFNAINTADRQLDLINLPANTAIAVSVDLQLDKLYNVLRNEFTSKDDEFKAAFENIEAVVKARKIELDKLLASINGTFKLCIAGSSPADLAIRIEVPDRNGELAAIIRREMRLASNAPEATLPLFFMPVKVKFNSGNITLSNPVPLSKSGTLAQEPAFANYLARIGTSGNSYSLINITPQIIATTNALMPPQLKKILNLKPFSAVFIGKHDPEGVYNIGAASFSGTRLVAVGSSSLLSAILLPALSSARDRARQVSCTSNLKQICVVLAMYAIDNKDQLPKPNGIAGLQQLIDGEYITSNVFSCASHPANYPDNKLNSSCPYIYIGGIYGKIPDNAGKYPVLFEKPGFHKVKYVNVAYADGHVEALQIPGYNNPAQVIGVLNQRNKYAPEMLDKMLKAITEN